MPALHRRGTLLLLVLPTLLAMACPRSRADKPAASSGGKVTLAFTSSVRGWTEPCGCTAEPLGGVDRIKAELDRLRAKGPVVLLDTGDFLFDRTEIPPAAVCQEEARVQLLLASARTNGLVATGLGPFDLSRGDDYRARLLKEHGIPAISANVKGAAGVRPRLMQEAGGLKIGITGVTWPEGAALPDGDTGITWQGLKLESPVKALAREAGALRQQGAQVVVVLGQMPRPALVQLVGKVPGIDLAILGHDPGESPMPPQEVASGTWLISNGAQGQYLGQIGLTIAGGAQSCCLAYDDNGASTRAEVERLKERAEQLLAQARDFESRKDAVNAAARRKKAEQLQAQAAQLAAAPTSKSAAEGNSFTFTAQPLDRKVGSDAALKDRLATYKASLAQLNAKCEQNVTCEAAPPGQPHFVGAQTCQGCHAEAYEFWQKAIITDPERAAQYKKVPGHPNPEAKVGHARAWQTLIDSKATANRDCIGCHTVGFEQPGGFCKVGDAQKWGNVSCESCHGPGSTHAESADPSDITLEVPETRCRQCHHVPHIQSTESFRYQEKLRLILGPGHGEDRLKALGGGK